MPFGDPGGNYASGGAVNQGGPSGPNSPGNNGNMGGGGGSGGSNVRSAYAGSRPSTGSGYTIPFGWQPYNDGTLQNSPDVWEALNNPAQWNYTDTPRQPGGSLSGGIVGFGGWNNPPGAGGANSGQGGMGAGGMGAGGMGAGSINGILAALAQHNFQTRNDPRRKSGHKLTRYLKERNNASR